MLRFVNVGITERASLICHSLETRPFLLYTKNMSKKYFIDTNKLLSLIAAGLCIVIFLVTIVAVIAGKKPGASYRRADPKSVEEIKNGGTILKEFKEFGTLRIRTLPPEGTKTGEPDQGALLVVSPWISYEADDTAFYEELVSKKKLFSTIIMEYFSGRTKNALLSIGEKNIKQFLLNAFNERLMLGKLKAVYFDDYIFLD